MHKARWNSLVFVCNSTSNLNTKCYREVCRGSGAQLGGGAAALGGKIDSTMNTKILFPINLKLLSQMRGFPQNNCDIFLEFMITPLPRMESTIIEIPCQYNLSARGLHHRCVSSSSDCVHHNFPPGSSQTGPMHLIRRSELSKLCGSIFQSEQTPVSTPVLIRIYSSPALSLKNSWSYISTPPICLHGMHRDSFTFVFT